MGIFQNHLMAAAASIAPATTDFYTHQIANSVRTHDSTSSSIKRTPGSNGNRQTWSISMWIKRCKVGETQFIFEAGGSGGYASRLFYTFASDDKIEISSSEVN